MKAKSAFRQILAAKGAEQCDKNSYHIAKLPRCSELWDNIPDLIILWFYFKIRLWVVTYWANLWRIFTNYNMSAIAANPYYITIFRKYFFIFHIFK